MNTRTEDTRANRFNIQAYAIESKTPLPGDVINPVLSKYTGTNLGIDRIVEAAAAVQLEYRNRGYPIMTVVIGQRQITNGVVIMNVVEGAFPQIVVSGQRYVVSSNGVAAASNPSAAEIALAINPPAAPAKTNAEPGFEVQKYVVSGNSLLSPRAISDAMTNAPGAFGTNVTFSGIQAALTGLQQAYRARGYVTVSVGLPQQRLTNATVNVQVTEGTLAAINVRSNRFFSSNNVMRALPSLHTNTVLNGLIFQAELNRANANQDRQIYPVISPGPEPATSDLTLTVKDRPPLHAKVELNNQSSPGTPDLRVNTSAVYGNLWQRENALGVQYSFSPEAYKAGSQWDFYDLPLVATYSAFYRLPLGHPESVADVVASRPGNFGFSEATRRFNLPPPSGQPELNFYASRATIDTGIENLFNSVIYNVPGVRQVSRQDVQQDITINEALGFRFTEPSSLRDDLFSTLSGGLDFKHYSLADFKTNIFHFTEITYKPDGSPNPPIVSTVNSAVPPTHHELEYLPVSLAFNLTWRAQRLTLTPGIGLSANLWHSGSKGNLQSVAGSTNSTGYWVALMPSLTADFVVATNWVLSFRASGQWANEPLISNEQFGAGGVSSVRGYHEGEVFGDTGWRVSAEQQTPPLLVGFVSPSLPLSVRGSVYMDYAETYLLDPQTRRGTTDLWGIGMGGVISVGSHWDARFLFSLPLLAAGTTRAYQPLFNFSLTSQF